MDIKKDFPLLNNKDIHYLDSAATTHKPQSVIDSLSEYYANENGNAGRGSHDLSMINTALVQLNREKVASFVGVSDASSIVFTKNTTESLNILAFGYAYDNLVYDDEIILAISNHHANIVPWQEICKRKNLKLKFIYLDKEGNLDLEQLKKMISIRTKIVSISAVVNSTGVIQKFEEVIQIAHQNDAIVILDCAQSIGHFKHEFEKWDVDFAVFSGHKMFAAQGVGVLYGKKKLLEVTSPLIFGGDMVEYVTEKNSTYKEVPHKFEGGTLDISAIQSMGKAIDYMEYIGYHNIQKIERNLMLETLFRLSRLDFVEVYYPGATRVGIIAFNVKGVHSHDTAFILNSFNVALRSGQHCCAPLMEYMGINSCCRISFNVYNTVEDVEALINALKKVESIFINK